MSSPQQGIYSTPLFELFRRGLNTEVIQRFRGMNSYSTLTTLGPEWAQDLLNVIVSGSGGLSKFRLPKKLSVALPNVGDGPNSFWDFQQGNGTRQVLALFGQNLYYYTLDLAAATLIESNFKNSGMWSFVPANNILFGANSQRMMKWTGSAWQQWGIQPAATPPTVKIVSFAGEILTGAAFDGSTAYISTADQIPSPTEFSWELWFQTSAAATQGLVNFNNAQTGGAGTSFERTLWMDATGGLNFGVYDPVQNQVYSIRAPGPYNDGNLHQAVVTIDATRSVSLYVDGAAVANSGGSICPDALAVFNGYWRMGEAQGTLALWGFVNAFFDGFLSHAAFYNNIVLTAAQVLADYNEFATAGQAAYEALVTANGPTYFWKLTDTTGSTAVDAEGANNGTYQGTVTLNQTVTLAAALSPAFGYGYGYAYMNSVTDHVGNVSLLSSITSAFTNEACQVTALPPNPADSQIDTLVWFRTLDGGGTLFALGNVNLATGIFTEYNNVGTRIQTLKVGAQYLQIIDASPDFALDTSTVAPLINNPPVQVKYLAVGQSRVFGFNVIGSPQDVIYSGYEQILIGRPEESFPPNNRLRLSIGAESVAGGGVLQSGVVAFSQTGRMYMLRGQVEDITLAVPVNFTQYLVELPWTLGCLSHFTIQNTSYGLVWLAGDKTVQLFDGSSEPIDISMPVYPLLRTITPGTESQCVAGYFNWLERDFYALLIATGGSLTLNKLLFFAANKQKDTNTIESVEVFVTDIPASTAATWVGLITTSKLQRMLCIGGQGSIQQLPVSSDTVNGITRDYTINPPTNGNLSAFWRGGYFTGSQTPYRSKMFRWARLVSDQDASTFQALIRLVDDETRTLVKPEIIGPQSWGSSKLGIGRKAKRCSIEIDFPAIDAPANVLELHVASIATADR